MLTSCFKKGLKRNIHLELLDKKPDLGDMAGNATTVSLPDAGVALQDFDTVSPQAGLMGFDGGVAFEVLTGALQDENSSLVTLPGDSWANESVAASA